MLHVIEVTFEIFGNSLHDFKFLFLNATNQLIEDLVVIISIDGFLTVAFIEFHHNIYIQVDFVLFRVVHYELKEVLERHL